MTREHFKAEPAKAGRVGVILFAISFGLYVLNVLVGKASVVYGWEVLHLGNVAEFLLLFIAAIAFIVAALHAEAVEKKNKLKG